MNAALKPDQLANPVSPNQANFHPDEWAARVQLAACYRIFAMFGWYELIYNHITVRLPDSVTGGQKQFLINPFGLMYSEVTTSNLLKIDLAGNKNYVVKGSALGYSTASSTLYGNNVQQDGVDVIRDTLFLTPFNGLPLPLYFDNDRPDPNTKKAVSTEPYNKSFKEYYGEKRHFINQYTQLLAKNGSVPMANNEMQQFFDQDIKVGFEKMTGFVSIMKSYLKQGKRLDVIIEGYASPLANASYNEYLTSRRINSVVKFLSTYSGGSLSKYIKNGQLTLRIRPLGESEAATNVSDDNNDPIRSIYSLEASKERRVVIKDIIIRQD